jgi:predicted transcriptional regulator
MQEIPKVLYNIPVAQVMIPINQTHVLALNSTYKDAHNLLKAVNSGHGSLTINETNTTVEMTSRENDLTASYHKDAMGYLAGKSIQVEIPQMDTSQQSHYSIKHYSPTVIPIVKSKRSMVIVGAVLKEDLEKSVKRILKIIQVTKRPPVSSKEIDKMICSFKTAFPFFPLGGSGKT